MDDNNTIDPLLNKKKQDITSSEDKDSSTSKRKSLRITLNPKTYDALTKKCKESNLDSNKAIKFSAYINDLLLKCGIILDNFGTVAIDRLSAGAKNNYLHKFFQVIEMARRQNPVISNYIYLRMENSIQQLLGLTSSRGVGLNRDEFETLIGSAFDTRSDFYLSITVIPPSAYLNYIGKFLQGHEFALKNEYLKKSIRIMAVSERDLFEDYKHDQPSFDYFMNWHQDKEKQDVHIFQINLDDLESIMHGLEKQPYSITMGLWRDRFALAFRYQDPYNWNKDIVDNMVNAQLSWISDSFYLPSLKFGEEILKLLEKKDRRFKDLVTLYNEFQMRDTTLGNYTEDLVSHWPEIVGWEKRKETSILFLENIIKEKRRREIDQNASRIKELRILDAAAGIGVEALEMCLLGHNITFNEPNKLLFKKSLTWMKENKKIESITNPQTKKVSFISDFHKILNIKNNLNLEAYNLPFNRLKHIFDKTPFGLILACGNILADVDNLNEFKYYLLDLFNIMDVQSLLVFDIRNFTRMQDSLNMEDEKSYKDFINNKYSGNYVYTGKNIIGAPRKIIKGKIEFVFYNKQTDDLINTFTSNDKKYSNVLMYNLKVNEIYDILKEQERVSNVEIFLDYQFDKKIDIDKVKEYELNSKIDKEQELTNDYFVFVVELK